MKSTMVQAIKKMQPLTVGCIFFITVSRSLVPEAANNYLAASGTTSRTLPKVESGLSNFFSSPTTTRIILSG
jgi:hypothetical protein